MTIGLLAASAFLWLFLVISTASISVITLGDDVHYGIFKYKYYGVTGTYSCGGDDGQCSIGGACSAVRFFSVTAILESMVVGVAATIKMSPMLFGTSPLSNIAKAIPNISIPITYGITAFSAFVCWACMASTKSKIENCSDGQLEAKLGASFGLMVVSFLIAIGCTIGSFLILKNGDVAHNRVEDDYTGDVPSEPEKHDGIEYESMDAN